MSRRTQEQIADICAAILQTLTECNPQTVRQVYYQLVGRHLIRNSRSEYQLISKLCVRLCREGVVPWAWMEDRLRAARTINGWDDLPDFAKTAVAAYARDVWPSQPQLVELWLEKDALSGIFDAEREAYGVTLNVGRGYDGWDSIHNAAVRYRRAGKPVTVLYFGDFDPSGEDMVRSLRERLGQLGAEPNLIKCALTMDDIERYNLPPDFTKASDSRRAKFVAKHGDVSVELDALPAAVLRERIRTEIEKHMDLDALAAVREIEAAERERLVTLLGAA